MPVLCNRPESLPNLLIVPTDGHCICVPFPAPFVPNKVAHVDVRFTRTGSLYFRHGLATKQVRTVLAKSCAGRNELSEGALGFVTADSFESPANCIALCTSAETCVSFELRHRDNRCSFSTSCTESVAIANSGDHDLYVMIDSNLRFELKNTMGPHLLFCFEDFFRTKFLTCYGRYKKEMVI